MNSTTTPQHSLVRNTLLLMCVFRSPSHCPPICPLAPGVSADVIILKYAPKRIQRCVPLLYRHWIHFDCPLKIMERSFNLLELQ